MMVSYSFINDAKQFKFDLHLKSVDSNKYVALGLSKDEKMGEDLVFFCRSDTGQVFSKENKNESLSLQKKSLKN